LSLEQATTLPFLTYRLACDGARVIRIENAERPDPNRFVGKDVLAEPAMRSYFLSNNCGKEAITLNLGHPEGQALLRELIVKLRVDVFACNQRPRSYARLGIEPPALCAVKPDLIWLGITGFGPEHDAAAYDPALPAPCAARATATGPWRSATISSGRGARPCPASARSPGPSTPPTPGASRRSSDSTASWPAASRSSPAPRRSTRSGAPACRFPG